MAGRDSVILILLITLLIDCCISGNDASHEYYCPREETLIGKNCYKNMKSAVMTKEGAETYCKSLNKDLLDSTSNQTIVSGWLKDTPGARDQVKDGYCIYSHPNPLGIASPNNPLFNVAPCSTLLHVLCAKQLPTGASCDEGWKEVTRNTFKFCVKPSMKRTSAAADFIEELCPSGSVVFSFNYGDNTEDLTYNSAAQDLLQPFWTPYFITNSKTVDWFTKTDARPFKTCVYKTSNLHVSLISCDTVKQFHCQTAAKEIPHQNTVDPDPYDPDKDYTCGTDSEDVLCENKCYKHRQIYKTQSEAEENCGKTGYKLTSHAVPCIQYVTGWVSGSFENGNLTTDSTEALRTEHCVYLQDGVVKLADCRVRTNALHTVHLEAGEEECPYSFQKCGDRPLCVGHSPEKVTWSDAVYFVPRDRRKLLATRADLDHCNETISNKLKMPLWIGAALSKGGVFEFGNGEEISVKSEKQCLKVMGGKLMTENCDSMMYYTCEKLAETSSGSRTIVIVLIVVPLIVLGLVLLLLYKKKGKEMCISRSSAGEDGEDPPFTLNNPLHAEMGAENGAEDDYEAVTSEKRASDFEESPYSEVDI